MIFAAAFLGDLLTYCVTSIQLALAYPSETGGVAASAVKFLGVFAPTQLPLAVLEGILTVLIVIGMESFAAPELRAIGFFRRRRRMAEHKKSNKGLVCVLILASILLVVVPFLALRGAEFGGSDDAGSQMVNEVTGTEYEPWFTPVLENLIGGEIPGEIESLIFCVQTGIGVGDPGVLLWLPGGPQEILQGTRGMMRGEKGGLSPMPRVLFCLGMMVTAVCSAHPFLGGRAFGGYAFVGQGIREGAGRKISRMFRLPLGFLALSGLVLLWEYSGVREGILSFSVGPGYLSMTRETVLRTILVTFRALGAVSALFALGMTTR